MAENRVWTLYHPVQLIPALPGTHAVLWEESDGRASILKLPVIAWVILDVARWLNTKDEDSPPRTLWEGNVYVHILERDISAVVIGTDMSDPQILVDWVQYGNYHHLGYAQEPFELGDWQQEADQELQAEQEYRRRQQVEQQGHLDVVVEPRR